MTDLMFLLLWSIGLAVLFAVACGIEWLWQQYEHRRWRKRFRMPIDWRDL